MCVHVIFLCVCVCVCVCVCLCVRRLSLGLGTVDLHVSISHSETYPILGRERAEIAQWLQRPTRDRKVAGSSLLERRENFLFLGRLYVLTLILVSLPSPCYCSST